MNVTYFELTERELTNLLKVLLLFSCKPLNKVKMCPLNLAINALSKLKNEHMHLSNNSAFSFFPPQ